MQTARRPTRRGSLALLCLTLAWLIVSGSPLRAEPGRDEPVGAGEDGAPPVAGGDAEAGAETLELLPADELFVPLIADPTWPRFSAEHEWRLGTDQFGRVGQVGFGETFAFVRDRLPGEGRWELGFQAQVDAIFDMTSSSFDLSNEDYFVGLTGSVERRGVTAQLRVSHLSSHVGDEYLLANGGGRESVSYESVDLLVSVQPFAQVRTYGGLGVLINPRPAFDPFYLQLGAEWRSPVAFWKDRLRPVAGVNLRIPQESDWEPDAAGLVALRLARPGDETRYVDFFLRAYHGRSPEGQFFEQKVDLIGLGLRLGL